MTVVLIMIIRVIIRCPCHINILLCRDNLRLLELNRHIQPIPRKHRRAESVFLVTLRY